MTRLIHCEGCQKVVTHASIFPTVLGTSLCSKCAIIQCQIYVRSMQMMESERRMAALVRKARMI